MLRHLLTLLPLITLLIACHKEPDLPQTPSAPHTDITDTIPNPDTTATISPCSIWQGHLVALVDTLAGGYIELTLISQKDWDKIYSANSATPNFDTLVRNYSESDLADWAIPTETQARRLKKTYTDDTANNTLRHLNAILSTLAADTIATTKGSQTVRYLCQEATKTYSFHHNTNVTTAGASTKYHLRLVRTVKLQIPHNSSQKLPI